MQYRVTLFALNVSWSLCVSSSIAHGVENFFLSLWGTGISNAFFFVI